MLADFRELYPGRFGDEAAPGSAEAAGDDAFTARPIARGAWRPRGLMG